MSSGPSSNIPGRITAPPEMLEPAVAELLRRIPDIWQEYNADGLSETQSQALFLLVAAGMVERRERLRLRMLNHPVIVEATITVTGEYGAVEAMQALTADLWGEWQEAWRQWKQGDTKDLPAVHSERLGPSEWRLTDQGVVARQDVAGGKQQMVFDFVLRRGFFDGQRRRLPDGRMSRREPVRGYGRLVSMTKAKPDAPPTVNIGNWKEGGDAFAQAFGPVLSKMFEAMQAQVAAAQPDARREEPGRTPVTASDKNARNVQFGGPEEDPHDPRVVNWFGKRLYLGKDTQISRLFQLLAGRLGYRCDLLEVQRAVEGMETDREEQGEEEYQKAMNRVRKAVTKLRQRLQEHDLDHHVVIRREGPNDLSGYTMSLRSHKS